MSDYPNVKNIVAEFLRRNGADGLYNDLHDCGCPVDDLMPCERLCTYCRPAAVRCCPDCGGKIYIPLGEAWQKHAMD